MISNRGHLGHCELETAKLRSWPLIIPCQSPALADIFGSLYSQGLKIKSYRCYSNITRFWIFTGKVKVFQRGAFLVVWVFLHLSCDW